MSQEYLDFVRDKIGGKNWVLARRTDRIVRQYGGDVICITQKRMKEIDRAWRVLYGDPYDKTRAAMYTALLAAQDELSAIADGDPTLVPDAILEQIAAAIEAEQNVR